MAEAFNHYHQWLGIPIKDQPPTHYRLLGIDQFESDPNVIEAAADRQMTHVRTYQVGQHSALSQKLLNELAAARICLLNPATKAEYDVQLRSEVMVPAVQVVVPAPQPILFPSTPVIASAPVVHGTHRRKKNQQPLLIAVAVATVIACVGIVAFVYRPAEEAVPKPPTMPTVVTSPQPATVAEPPKPPSILTPEPKPPVGESPEQAEQRLEVALASAKRPTDFKTIAEEALKAADQAVKLGNQEIGKDLIALALSAAKTSEDDGLARRATVRAIEAGISRSDADSPSPDKRETEELVLLKNGRANVRVKSHKPWKEGDGFLEGEGIEMGNRFASNLLAFPVALDEADFCLDVVMSLELMGGRASSIVLYGTRQSAVLYIDGAGGQILNLLPKEQPPLLEEHSRRMLPSKVIKPGVSCRVELRRQGNMLLWSIDGHEIATLTLNEKKLGVFGISPWRDRLRLYEVVLKR